MKVTAAVVEEENAPFPMQDLDLDETGPAEPVVRIVATGICHTDEFTRRGHLPISSPALGHEGVGEVVTVGDGVTQVQVGDQVAFGAGHGWVPVVPSAARWTRR